MAGTYLLGALITRGDVKLLHLPVQHLGTLPHLLEQMGAVVESGKDWIHVQMEKRCRPIPNIVTAPFPGIFHRSSVGIDGSVVHGGWHQFCRRKNI